MAAVTKGLAIATKGMEELTKHASKVREAIQGTFRVLDQEITISCPEKTERISIAFEASGGVLGRKVRFPFGRPNRVLLRPLKSLSDITVDSVTNTTEGFEIDTKGMAGEDIFLMEVEYSLPTDDFLEALVERNSAREVPKDRENEYWMHAELKHPKVLRTKVGKLDLRDVDFSVDVGISEDIKMVIPPTFKREIDIAARLLAARDPRQKTKLGYAHAAAMRARGQGQNLNEILGDLQELFLPDGFKKFVEVTRDFRYSDCVRGVNFYDTLPIPTWPKSMTVVSRTDLNLDRCAAEGLLVYRKSDFLKKVGKILGIALS